MAKSYTTLFEVLRDLNLYQKVRTGDVYTLADIQQLAVSRWPWMVTNWSTLSGVFTDFSNGNNTLMDKLVDLQSFVDSYKLGNVNINPFNSSATYNNFYSFINLIEVQNLNLTNNEIDILNNKIKEMNEFTIDNFKSAIAFMKKVKAISYNNIGLGDPDGNALYGITATKQQKQAAITDLEATKSISDLIRMAQGFIYDLRLTQQRPPNLLYYSQANISLDSEVQLELGYLSGISIPFEISLEHMATKFLGDIKRWYEIATINKLQPPFIDESGTKFSLLAPGAANNLIVSIGATETVAVGTKINIGSYGVREESRIVEKVIKNENGTVIIYLSGSQDINKLKTSEQAFIRVYKPGTTRKGEFIIIPTTTAIDVNKKGTPVNASLRALPESYKQFGIDLGRDFVTRDLIISANGYIKPSFGVDAIRKTVLNLIRTKVGDLPFHPTYGINTGIGENYFGTVDEAVLFGELIRDSILADPRFSQVLILSVSATGNSLSLSLSVQLNGTNGFIPLTFNS